MLLDEVRHGFGHGGIGGVRVCAGAQRREVQQLDAQVVFVLVVDVPHFKPRFAQQLAHLERGLTEPHRHVLAAVHRLPWGSRGRRRAHEQLRVFDGRALRLVFACFRALDGSFGIARACRDGLRHGLVVERGKRFPKRRIQPHRRRHRHRLEQRVADERIGFGQDLPGNLLGHGEKLLSAQDAQREPR